MEQETIVFSGELLLPPQTKLSLKKNLQQRFCLLYKSSKFGIERLEIYENKDDTRKRSASRIITLEDCVKITPKGPNHFTVYTKTATHEFTTVSEETQKQWIAAFQSVAFRDDVSRITSIEEDNDLYCSSGEGVFNVKLHPSDASKRCGLEAKYYTLVLTATALQLRTNDNKILYTWPYRFIRRYGYRDGKFTFEAGRKCETGEGVFHLEHSNQQEIFRSISSKMKSMKKVLSGEITPTLIDCGDTQFHAALSMEARSRSPLPPSPTSSSAVHDIDLSGSDVSIDKINFRLPPWKPSKPPRRNLPLQLETNDKDNNNGYDADKYDTVECRSEAWRTFGVGDIKHTELNIVEDEPLEEYISWQGGVKPSAVAAANRAPPPPPVVSKASKVITQPAMDDSDESYDKLQFFGSSSKLDVSAGYKQVLPSPVVPMQPTAPPSFNDYDEVETNIEGVRSADDSHLGYGIIRKTALNKQTVAAAASAADLNHKMYNDEQYAVISKPKRV